jgi:hypothetical protein
MVKAGCHVGKGIICLDEANASAPCRRDHTKCGWAKYPDITYVFRCMEIEHGWSIDIPSNAIAINTNKDSVTWLEPTVIKKDEGKKE